MLFIQSNTLSVSLGEGERLRLLESLAAGGLRPLIRASRRRAFELLLAGRGDAGLVERAAAELERRYAGRRGQEDATDYTPGEMFGAGDCVLFLVFGAGEGLSAGVIYSVETAGPLSALESFCRDVREALVKLKGFGTDSAGEGDGGKLEGNLTDGFPDWKTRADSPPQGLARFIAVQPTDFDVVAKCRGGGRELVRACELMEQHPVRLFLRRVQEMRREGYSPRRLFAEADTLNGVSVERLLEAGLLEREVRISCRKSGHALFDLPTPDSLAAITISKAKCSLCAAPVADEVVEETINPTRLAVSLLEDGGWLNNRVYNIIRSLGVPDSEIANGPTSSHGESYLAAEVCGNSFLFVTRDGDLTPAFSRRVVETVSETEATHLVAVVNGAVEDEGRMRLYEFAWRRARDGQDLDMIIVEGLGAARAEVERAFERAVHRGLSRRLFPLDSALGLSASNFVRAWFKVARAGAERRRDEGRALSPSFSEFDERIAS
jgi:hypothetical protein